MVMPGSSTPSLLAAEGDNANCLQDQVQPPLPSGAPVRGSMKLPHYNGEAPPETYLIQVQLAAQLNQWSTEETAVQVALALEGRALQILTDLQPEEHLSWPAVATAMQSRFGLRTHADDARDKLASRPRRQEKSLGAYAADLRLYAGTLLLMLQHKKSLLSRLYVRLQPKRLQEHIRLHAPETLAAALTEAERVEHVLSPGARSPGISHQVRQTDYERSDQEEEARQTTNTPLWRSRRGNGRAGGQSRAAVKLMQGGATEELPPATTLSSESHLRVGRLGQTRGLYLDCDLAGTTCRALIDTGSTLSLVQAGVLPGTDGPRPQGWQPTQLHITTVTGERAKVKGERSLPVTVANCTVDHQFWLASIQDQCIIGLDLLAKWEATVDPASGSLRTCRRWRWKGPLLHQQLAWSTETKQAVEDLYQRSCEGFQADQQRQLREILDLFADIFAAKDEDCMQTSLAGLRLHPKKCHLFRKETTFLGHVVSGAGVSTDPAKVAAVKDWPIPGNTAELRSFLGLASYYRRFVKDFATIASPLHWLTQKGREFHWSEDCAVAFDRPRSALVEAPVLAYPDLQLPFVVDTDASNTCVGAVLSQEGPEGERVISYYSHSLSRPERNYCVTRRELLAIILGLRHFRPYLYGKKFLLRTDHVSLTWLLSFKEPEGQLALWLEMLQDYHFEVRHRAGRLHTDADALSRRPCEEKQCRYCQRLEDREGMTSVIASPQGGPENDSVPGGHCSSLQVQSAAGATEGLEAMDPQQLQHDQNQDPALSQVQCWIGAGQRPSWPEVSALDLETKALYSQWANLTNRNGLLYRRWQAPGGHREGNRYVLVAMDYFTKWPEACAVPDQSAVTPAERLVNEMFCRFGLAILTSCQQRDWDQHLPLVLMAYRSAVQESTKCTPAALMSGHELRTPVDLVFGSPPEQEVSGDPGLDYLHNLLARLREVHQLTRQALRDAGSRQKRAYDTRCKGEGLLPGQHVWVYSPERKKGLSPKLMSQWVGPCTVLERLSDVDYRVWLVKRNRVVVRHRDRLAPYQPLNPSREESGSQLQLQAPNLASEAAGGPTERPQ
ncbi:unnamed protein product [Oreochromis niloticus]|nr:unnamed protein product [Mustela putorius furo]